MKNKFAKQLGLLGIIGLVIKIIGALYRLPLAYIMPENAVTYYSIAYPWYTFLIVISTSALPAVIAKLTAEYGAKDDLAEQALVFDVSRRLMKVFGIMTVVFLSLMAFVVSKSSGYPESIYSFFVLAIASYFVASNAAYRGYFQGTQRLEIFGLSQLFEQMGRVILGLLLVWILSKMAAPDSWLAAAGTSGAAFGALISWIYASYKYKKMQTVPSQKIVLRAHKSLIQKILKMVFPIALGASIMPLLTIIDATMIIWRLRQTGFGDQAGVMYTFITFYSVPIINLAQVIFTALQVSLLPMITRAFTQKSEQFREKVYLGVLTSLLLGLPMGLGIAVFSREILVFLYPNKAEMILGAAPVLGILGLGVAFLSLYQATTGILQGINHYKKPVRNLFVGAVVKVITAYILLGIPTLNIKGAAISTLLAYAVAATLNMLVLLKHVEMPKSFIKKASLTLMSNVVMIVAAKGSFILAHAHLGDRLSLLVGIFVAIIAYAAMMLMTKVVTKEDLTAMDNK
ncbi:putative polysaccharide biosynthesis protein [Fusibacter ferrireducens]|uniref:Polysaccharide biosynthesis protein n=1 Tax=Fusibacter ferrireducens TaxID=2785058 RepID=A0ABR9ZSF0_9FIRM|nr:polysaccharide biosynthesis protein [Fusibacter ferrireducens]MBF4693048.1 polysaccharide biosynthesis protein [Fusibacter ferrireducens]